jgi:hypothetical protein
MPVLSESRKISSEDALSTYHIKAVKADPPFGLPKKDSEIVQAEYLRDSLLEMTRNQSSEWTEMAAKAQGGGAGSSHHHLDQFQHQYFHQHQFHQFQ